MQNFNKVPRKKTKDLAIQIIPALSKLKSAHKVSVIRKQIIAYQIPLINLPITHHPSLTTYEKILLPV